MTRGIVLRGPDRALQAKAESLRLGVVVAAGLPTSLPFDQTLLVAPRTPVPWAALDKAMQFLKRWDAVVPLWRYGVLAGDLGTAGERRITEALTLDLRIPVYACELLFVRRNEAGQALLSAWREECGRGQDERLAFLRALARVKPRLCVLPTAWLDGAPRLAVAGTRRGVRRPALVQPVPPVQRRADKLERRQRRMPRADAHKR